MGITKNYLLGALFAALLAGVGCHSSQKSATTTLPAQANAPTLTAAASPKPQPATKSQGATKAQSAKPKPATEEKKASAPAKVQPVQPAPKPDPVGELITQVEREYQAGRRTIKLDVWTPPSRASIAHSTSSLGVPRKYVQTNEYKVSSTGFWMV
ncbi:MAG TPA: hypothetical protein VK555_12125 [Terriglobales bacterium]|nr:hypothetical protein [Terriglobales bacterium]